MVTTGGEVSGRGVDWGGEGVGVGRGLPRRRVVVYVVVAAVMVYVMQMVSGSARGVTIGLGAIIALLSV